jgi:hypothetical protein
MYTIGFMLAESQRFPAVGPIPVDAVYSELSMGYGAMTSSHVDFGGESVRRHVVGHYATALASAASAEQRNDAIDALKRVVKARDLYILTRAALAAESAENIREINVIADRVRDAAKPRVSSAGVRR